MLAILFLVARVGAVVAAPEANKDEASSVRKVRTMAFFLNFFG